MEPRDHVTVANVNADKQQRPANSKGSNSSFVNPEIDRNVAYEDSTKCGSNKSMEFELKKLSFRNPGKLMEDFDPEKNRRGRNLRRVSRKVYTENFRKSQLLYDESGISLENSQDLCDCLDVNCPGCHFPCPKCGSEKCGTECRCSRKWTYDEVQVEGTSIIMKWPS